MSYFDVFVVDRVTHAEVFVGSLLSRVEAAEILKVFEKYDCDGYAVRYHFERGRYVKE